LREAGARHEGRRKSGERKKREEGVNRDAPQVVKVFWKGGGDRPNFLRNLFVSKH
jgi:hypothetical protein